MPSGPYSNIVGAGIGQSLTKGDPLKQQTLINMGTGAELTPEQKKQKEEWENNPIFQKQVRQILIQIERMKQREQSAGMAMAEGGYVESYEEGGEVEGEGTGTSDSIDAKLSDGEFVFTAKAVEVIGADNLQKIMEEAERQYDERTSLSKARSMFGKFLKG